MPKGSIKRGSGKPSKTTLHRLCGGVVLQGQKGGSGVLGTGRDADLPPECHTCAYRGARPHRCSERLARKRPGSGAKAGRLGLSLGPPKQAPQTGVFGVPVPKQACLGCLGENRVLKQGLGTLFVPELYLHCT